MLPEEKELARLEAEQAELREQVTSAELGLETIKTETTQFQHRYYQALGRLYAELDEIDARIANLRAKLAPDDPTLTAHAHAAERQAKESAEEAGLNVKKPKPPPVIEPALKQVYRQAVKLMHPDLATTEHERQRRTALMALVNLAYERGDQKAIEKLMEEYGQDPEAIVGEDIGSRLVKVIRRIAQLRRRLGELQQQIEAYQNTAIFTLTQTIEKAEAIGDDPLGNLAKKLVNRISERKGRLNTEEQRAAL
jgi:DNA repair exonuclease SbcCD ATPase subunit